MLYPVPAVMVSCARPSERPNIITVAWTGTVCSNPAMVSISVRPQRYSYNIIRETGEFVINLTTEKLVRATDYCGVRSGRDVDKFQEMHLTAGKADKVSAPLIQESPVNIECRVKDVMELGTHHMFLAEVVAVDIVEDKDTLVRREFKPFLTDEDEKNIRDKFKNTETIPDDDINTSVDQTKRLIMAIKNNDLRYPEVKNGYFRHDVVLEFLKKLSNVFQWKIYESSTLGKDSLLSWYAVILCEWMEGNGLNYIMRAALKHHREKPDDFWINRYTKGVYDDTSLIHRNIVFADTLEVIENIILFSISNYFLRFSNEFRRIKGDDELDANNWYEYVEYGTTNPLTILLQRNGFSRESARFIKENPEYVVKDGSTGKLKLKASLSKCGRTSVENEVEYIRQNVPGIFVDEEE